MSESSGPLLSVVAASGVGVPDWLFSAIALVAVANGALLTMIMASRLTYGMAEAGLLPAVLSKVLPQRRTPWVAIVATTAVAMVLTLVGDLSTLAETVVLLLLFVFISTNVAVLVLRRDTVEHRAFPRVDGGPGARRGLVRAAADPANGHGVAVRGHPVGRRRGAVRGGACGDADAKPAPPQREDEPV